MSKLKLVVGNGRRPRHSSQWPIYLRAQWPKEGR